MNEIVSQNQVLQTARSSSQAVADVEAPQQYLTFQLSGEMFALAILNVKEIIEYGNLTEIPMMPPFIRGVINLRGAAVPVIDQTVRFGGQRSEVGKRTCIVIVEMKSGEEGRASQDIGIIVDAVSEVLEIPQGDIEPPPSFGAKIRADFIAGMGKVDGNFVIILNIDRVLSVEELTQLSQAAGSASSMAAAED
jgi:purine-binding chemotaxis protein CheW